MPQRGLLIIVEGLDRSGKTTQCQRLVSSLQTHTNQPVKLQKFPDRTTPSGQLINSYLTNQTHQDDHAIHLLFSANRWEARTQLLADLQAGITVVVDRYSFSGAVYSAAKGNEALGLEWAWAPEIGLPVPDLVVFLDLEMEVAARRGGWGEERYENVEMQRRVRGLYRELFGRVVGVGVGVVDAGVGVDEVAGRVWECYSRAERSVRGREGRSESVEIGRLVALKDRVE